MSGVTVGGKCYSDDKLLGWKKDGSALNADGNERIFAELFFWDVFVGDERFFVLGLFRAAPFR